MTEPLIVSTLRLYHFVPAKYALENIAERRLKLAEINELNDPFELWSLVQKDRTLRTALRDYKSEMHRRFGLMCFCREWKNPLLWSHYADKHRGMCLGFDIPHDRAMPVNYVQERPAVPFPFVEDLAVISNRLISTKYIGWQYEQELRRWVSLEGKARDSENKLHFYHFDKTLRLREVIAGPLCSSSRLEIESVLGDRFADTKIIKARLAFTSFDVIEKQNGFDSEM